jgi:hypothetical protein
VILIVALLAGGSCSTLRAQDATMTDGEACTVLLRSFFPALKEPSYLGRGLVVLTFVTGGESTPSGIRFLQTNKKDVLVNYSDVMEIKEKDFRGTWQIHFEIPAHKGGDRFINLTVPAAVQTQLVQALNKFVSDAHAGHPYDCHDLTPAEAAAVAAAEAAKGLVDFQQRAATWQAMNPKPPVSDEVTKKRLLAEDAVQEKNFAAAGDYYSDGIAIDPTWAPGWYNAALISAELKNYSAAANYMKHYLILLPGASDAAAAKEKVLLWEAKAEQTSRK